MSLELTFTAHWLPHCTYLAAQNRPWRHARKHARIDGPEISRIAGSLIRCPYELLVNDRKPGIIRYYWRFLDLSIGSPHAKASWPP